MKITVDDVDYELQRVLSTEQRVLIAGQPVRIGGTDEEPLYLSLQHNDGREVSEAEAEQFLRSVAARYPQ